MTTLFANSTIKNLTIIVAPDSVAFGVDNTGMSFLKDFLAKHADDLGQPTVEPTMDRIPDRDFDFNGGANPNVLSINDVVRYTRADGSSFTGTVQGIDGDYNDNTLAIHILKDDNGKMTTIKAIGDDMTGRFDIID